MEQEERKIGAGHAQAMLRQGLKELAQVLPAFPGQGVHVVEEPGLAGCPTPQEVVQGKGAYEQMLDGYTSRAPQQERQPDRGLER